jgi:hypothetical protein
MGKRQRHQVQSDIRTRRARPAIPKLVDSGAIRNGDWRDRRPTGPRHDFIFHKNATDDIPEEHGRSSPPEVALVRSEAPIRQAARAALRR